MTTEKRENFHYGRETIRNFREKGGVSERRRGRFSLRPGSEFLVVMERGGSSGGLESREEVVFCFLPDGSIKKK